MQKIYFAILLFAISNHSYSQLLSYSDLKYIYQNNLEKAEILLSKKGYKFFEREEATADLYPSTKWTYKRSSYDNTAKSFVIKYCDQSNCGFAWYQFDDQNHFNNLREICKQNGYKLIETKSDPFGNLDYTYSNNIFQIVFTTGVNKDGENIYFINFDEK